MSDFSFWLSFSRTQTVQGVGLHFLDLGSRNAPPVFLLHGFPGFWWDWERLLGALIEGGYRVIVPDGRGYNLSDKPSGRRAYTLDLLAGDVIGLADALGLPSLRVVGHDWGGIVAMETALRFPERITQLGVLNAPHPDVFGRVLQKHPTQFFRSLYVLFFQLPWLPETVLTTRNFFLLRRALFLTSRSRSFSAQEMPRYLASWSQPQALTAMLNYYRALRYKPLGSPRPLKPPALILWGEKDGFLERGVALESLKRCERGQIQFFSEASHWILRDTPDRVSGALLKFFAEAEG